MRSSHHLTGLDCGYAVLKIDWSKTCELLGSGPMV